MARLRNARAARSPNLVPHLLCERVGSTFWTLYEALEGRILDIRGPIEDPDRQLLLARRLAGALASLHRSGLVHGALHPSCVVDRGESWAILGLEDLDAARIPRSLSAAETARDIALYTAPEQFSGTSSPQGDVFAACAILYHCVAGRAPHTGADGNLALATRLRGALPNWDGIEVPRDLREALEKGLSDYAEARFSSGAEMETALGACRGGEGQAEDLCLKAVQLAQTDMAGPSRG